MRTARSLTVPPCLVVSHACPPRSNHAHPPGSNHAPPEQPRMPPRSNHTHPPQSNHACLPPPEQPRMPPLEQPHMPPPEQPCMPPPEQPCMPPLKTEWQTGVKILPCPNFVAGGKNRLLNLQPKLDKVSSCLMRHKINSIQIVIVRVAVHCPSFPSTRGALNFTWVQQWCKLQSNFRKMLWRIQHNLCSLKFS